MVQPLLHQSGALAEQVDNMPGESKLSKQLDQGWSETPPKIMMKPEMLQF